MGIIYDVALTGQTLAGNTNFPSENTTYTPLEGFNRTGTLTVEPGFIPRNSDTTDLNVFDIGLFSGSVEDISAEAGEIKWASNDAIYPEFGLATGTQGADIDETFQSFDSTTNTLNRLFMDSRDLEHGFQGSGTPGGSQEDIIPTLSSFKGSL